MAPDGSIITENGYHYRMAAWVDLGSLKVAPPKENPTPDDMVAAMATIHEIFCDFNFTDDASRANTYALMFLPFVRQLIDGPTPLWMVTASTPGTGKGLLLDVLSLLATGEPPLNHTESRSNDEWRKSITSLLNKSPTSIRLDNIKYSLTSGALASALTCSMWSDRLLGHNDRQIELPNDAVWTATANNPDISDEIARRTVFLTLATPEEKPWRRTGFRHSPLTRWVLQHRTTLIEAIHTCLRYWVIQGQPKWEGLPLGSFEACCELLGGVLDCLGMIGFLENRELIYDRVDAHTADLRGFVDSWWHRHGGNHVCVAELHTLATDQDLLDWALGDGNERSQKSRLGRRLRKCLDRVFGSFRICEGPRTNNAATYFLEYQGDNGEAPHTANIGDKGTGSLF
jgi:hypothetical protein